MKLCELINLKTKPAKMNFADQHNYVKIDIPTMKKALAGPFRTVPDNLTREELKAWLFKK